MLHTLIARLRPAPPPPVDATAVPRPLYEGLTSAEYLRLLRNRVDARREAEADLRREWQQVDDARARIARMKRAIDEAEAIRSSRFVTTTTKEK